MPSHHSVGSQAVVLCGPGTSLYPFTGAEDLPKALLPIANKPMLHYPLEWCEKAGFDSILVLTLSEHHAAIQSYLRSHRIRTNCDVQVEAASAIDDNLGTADVIRVAFRKGWLNSDFAVLPCDLVTTLDASKITELWMVTQAGFDADLGRRSRKYRNAADGEDGRRGGLGVWYETLGEGAVKGQETDFLATAPLASSSAVGAALPEGEVGTLLTTMPTQALKGLPEIPIRNNMLTKHPNLKLYSTYRDSGIYYFPHWVLKFIERNPKLNSLREDVLPWLAKARWQNQRLAKKLGLLEILSGGGAGDNDSEDGATQVYDIGSMSSTRVSRPRNAASKQLEIPSITTYLPSATSTFIRRVDTTHLYLFTSLHLAKSDPTVPSTQIKVDPSAYVDPKAIITSMDCLIADKVSVGEKAIVKKSVLGTGVSLGKGVRLTGCVLMDGAAVAEGAKLEGCTIGRKAVIGAKAVLKDCEVAEGFIVEDGAEAKNERFVAFSGLDADPEDFEGDSGEASDDAGDIEEESDEEGSDSGAEEEEDNAEGEASDMEI